MGHYEWTSHVASQAQSGKEKQLYIKSDVTLPKSVSREHLLLLFAVYGWVNALIWKDWPLPT